MGSLLQRFNEWEIQLLVVLSFVLQIFLFFTGCLRQRGAKFLSATIWVAYLVADLVAVYALGLLSKQEANAVTENQHPLAFFWAPFLLIHLGGQDTITAFSLEDNSLWLRHLLNLIVQVVLALYVFWRSTGWRNVQLLVPGIFMFIAGIIKYGERTMALMYGNLQNIGTGYNSEESNKFTHQELDQEDSYSSIVCFSLDSAPIVRHLFAGFTLSQIPNGFHAETWMSYARSDEVQLAKLSKLVDIELGIMYCDVYTKAAVLRTRHGIVLRCTSQVAAMVALVLFIVVNKKQRYYSRADIAITYTLFVGSLFLEVCAMFMMVMVSPWTWAWLKANKFSDRLIRVSWTLVSSKIIGWPEEKPLWSNNMGQYNFLSYVGCEEEKPSSPLERVIRKMAKAVGKLFWLSKLLDTKYEQVDKDIRESFAQEIKAILQSPFGGSTSGVKKQEWQHLGRFLHTLARELSDNFSAVIIRLHISTIIHLSEVSSSVDVETAGLVDVCRKLSNYMMYLLVTHPVMLQVTATSAESVLEGFGNKFTAMMRGGGSGKQNVILQHLKEFLLEEASALSLPEPCKETLEEMRDMWVRIIMYAAGHSRPETHAAQLARGGEFLTFIWLLMAHKNLGSSVTFPVDLISPPTTFGPLTDVRFYAFDFRS
ncbi:unnamed protein product [Urochloa decumbens]|uniref:DUF4220 domain-containing protein n=1 Tax=Urochloa decumbens TaxID=240449 RepID=A0ABC9AQ29_9POAL